MITEQWLKENGNKNVSELLKELSVNEFLSLLIQFNREVYNKEKGLIKL